MLAVLLVMAAVILAETSALFAREFFKTKEQRTEQRVEQEMQKPPLDPITATSRAVCARLPATRPVSLPQRRTTTRA